MGKRGGLTRQLEYLGQTSFKQGGFFIFQTMIDTLTKPTDIGFLHAASDQYGLRPESIDVLGRITQPRVPMLMIDGQLLDSPPYYVDAEIWQKLVRGAAHLSNPFTSFRRLTPDIHSAAIDLFSAGVSIFERLKSGLIVLPRTIAISPDRTAPKNLNQMGIPFVYNAWYPAMGELTKVDCGQPLGVVERANVRLVLTPKCGREHSFRLSFYPNRKDLDS